MKTFDIIRTFHDLQGPTKSLANCINDRGIAAIRPDEFQATPAIAKAMFDMIKQFLQGQQASGSILNAGAMHDNQQHQSQNVYHQVSLAARRLLVHIHTAFFAAFRSLYTLAVKHCCARSLMAPGFLSHFLHQYLVNPLPQTVLLPTPIVEIHRSPWRKIDGQHPPLAAGTIDVQYRIDHLPFSPLGWTTHLESWKELRNLLPFGILEIGRVGLGEFSHSPILPNHFLKRSLRNSDHQTVPNPRAPNEQKHKSGKNYIRSS